MGAINKTFLREEAARIQTVFKELSADNKINNECKKLMQSMIILINLLISIFLEKKTIKTSENSSKPPLQTEKDESGLTNKGTHSKGKDEANAISSNTRTVESTIIAKVTKCDVCGRDLTKTACQHYEQRTKIDIVFEKTVEHIDAEVKWCPRCDSTVKSVFPDDMPGPLQYGSGLKAYIINLLIS